jgi:hypothetical protein
VSFSGGGGSGAAAYAIVGNNTTVKSIGNTIQFATPSGVALSLYDSASTVANYVQMQGRAAGAPPLMSVTGTDTNINYLQSSKGTGQLSFYTNGFSQEQLRVAHTASAVNYVQVTGAATGGTPIAISAQGSDASVNMTVRSKGNGYVGFTSGGGSGILLGLPNGSANYLTVASSNAGSAPILASAGADTNIDLTLTPKGTGQTNAGGAAFNARNGLVVNSQTINTSYTIAVGDSAMSAGPITIASGQSVTLSSGSRWVVL